MTDNKTERAPEKTTSETLMKDGLTLANKDYAKGDTVEVTREQRDFLRERGFIADTTAAAAPAAANTKKDA